MKPWLSVLMPTYRGERYVGAALGSLTTAPRDAMEVVVVDDGSDDRTIAIVDAFRAELTIRVVDGPRRGNWVASTNRALEAAAGTYSCFLHQDDGWVGDRFAAIRAAFARTPDARLLVHPVEFRDRDGAPLGRWRTPFDGDRTLDSTDVVESLLVQNFLGIPSPAFRTDDARAAGGLREDLWYTADWDLWLSLARLGPVLHRAAPMAWFRVHAESQTATRSADSAAFRAQMDRVLDRHLDAVTDRRRRAEVARASRLAIETNVALARLSHGAAPDVRALAAALGRAGPASIRRFVRDARLSERVSARVVDRLRRAGKA